MQFAFAKGTTLPFTVRLARSLTAVQGGILLLLGFFVLGLTALGVHLELPFAGVTIAGVGAVLIGVLYGALGVASTGFAVMLGRPSHRIRTALVGLEAVLTVLFLARGDLSWSMFVSVALCVAVAVLLVTPSASALFGSGHGEPASQTGK